MCPQCKEELEYLLCIITSVKDYIFQDGSYEVDERTGSASSEVRHYRCPHCEFLLARDETQAKILLAESA